MLVRRAGLLLVLCALLGACAGTKVPRDDKTIAVASDVMLQLLPAKDVLHDVSVTQRIDASYSRPGEAAQTRNFIVQVEAGTNDMRMVGLTPMGVQLFAVTLQETELAVDVPPYLSLPFDPRYMLADMQLSLADTALLNAHLAGGAIRTTGSGGRELIANGAVRLRIDYTGKHRGQPCEEGSETRIEHIERRYRIQITTLSCDRS